jgi:hypothetical protein
MRLRILLAVVSLVGVSASADPAFSPQRVANSIATSGARATLSRIYEDQGQWAALLAGIATGKPLWLDLAKQLRRVSDAGASEQIDLAAGEALEHRPANVLALVLEDFGISAVCGGPDVDDPRFNSYDLSMRAISLRQEKVRAIRDARLTQKRNACILELDKAKSDIGHFYGRGE